MTPTMRRLVYIAAIRLPTEKAHGLQVVRMCDAFARQGVATTLFHPARHQPGGLAGRDVHAYYGTRAAFDIRTLPNVDVVRAEPYLPAVAFLGLLFVHSWLWARFAVARAVRFGPADLFFTRDIPVAAQLLRRRLPVVLELHKAPERLSLPILRRVARHPSLRLLVMMTEELRTTLAAAGVRAEHEAVVHDGVDLDRFDTSATPERCADEPTVLYTGQLFAEKGIATLVAAARFLPSARVVVAGGMPHHVARWREQVASAGQENVEFLGHRDPESMPALQRSADVLVLPNSGRHPHSSRYTSPMKLFEYMAAGRPIVASDVPAIREVLRHDVNAWLVTPDDPEALAAGIAHLLHRPALCDRLAAQAQSDVRRHTWDARARTIAGACGFSLAAGAAAQGVA